MSSAKNYVKRIRVGSQKILTGEKNREFKF